MAPTKQGGVVIQGVAIVLGKLSADQLCTNMGVSKKCRKERNLSRRHYGMPLVCVVKIRFGWVNTTQMYEVQEMSKREKLFSLDIVKYL